MEDLYKASQKILFTLKILNRFKAIDRRMRGKRWENSICTFETLFSIQSPEQICGGLMQMKNNELHIFQTMIILYV